MQREMATIAIPLADGFEDLEFIVPRQRLTDAGHRVTVFGAKAGERVHGKRGQATARIEEVASALEPENFDALVIPGGHAPDALRMDRSVVSFVRRFWETGRPVAAVCHGPQLLIEADVVRDRRLTSYPSIKRDLANAGAVWVDREVVQDRNLITSRRPDDLEAFCDAILTTLSGR
jgi:protease I